MVPNGYLSPEYAQSLAEFGEIVRLPRSGIRLLRRDIDGVHHDLCGLYPYAMARDWAAIAEDIAELREGDAVSLVLVTDPFAAERCDWPTIAVWDMCRPFKPHQVVDLGRDWRGERKKKLRYLTRRALAAQRVGPVENPGDYATLLWKFYRRTIDRFGLTGIQAMSEAAIADQLAVPGAALIVAHDEEGPTGAMLCFDHGHTSNSHLLFLSDRAERLGTSYALYYGCLEAAEDRHCRLVNFGSGAGAVDDPGDGLLRFKRRWANREAATWLCGAILDRNRYTELCRQAGTANDDYFPAYRTT